MTRRRIALLCLLAGALLIAVVPWTLRSDRIAAALARQIKQGYGVALSSNSQLTLTLLPLPQLVLSGVRLASPDGVLVAEADELRSQLRLLPILQGRLRLHKVQMERGRITLALSEKPNPTIAGSLARLRERLGTNPESRWVPRIDRFVLIDGDVTIRERTGSEVARLKHASLILNSPEPDGDVDFTASAEWKGSVVLATLSGLNLAAIRAGRPSEVEGEIGSPLGRGTIAGTLTWSDHPSFKGAVRSQIVSLDKLATWSGLGVDVADVARPASLTADGTVDLDKIQWPRATFDLGVGRLDGALAVQFGARPQLRATLASEDVELGWLAPLVASHATPLAADYDVRLSASTLGFGRLRLKDAAISIQTGVRGVEASLGRAGFAGGTLRGRVSAGWDAERDMRLTAFADGIDLETALGEMGDPRSLTGIAGGQVTLEATGDRAVPFARQLRGRASIQARNGEVGGILFGDAGKRAATPSLPNEWRAGRVRFTQGVLALDIAGGRAEVAQGTIETAGTRSQLSGHIDLAPPSAALRLLMQPTGSGASRPPLLLDVAGPLQNLNLGVSEAAAR